MLSTSAKPDNCWHDLDRRALPRSARMLRSYAIALQSQGVDFRQLFHNTSWQANFWLGNYHVQVRAVAVLANETGSCAGTLSALNAPLKPCRATWRRPGLPAFAKAGRSR